MLPYVPRYRLALHGTCDAAAAPPVHALFAPHRTAVPALPALYRAQHLSIVTLFCLRFHFASSPRGHDLRRISARCSFGSVDGFENNLARAHTTYLIRHKRATLRCCVCFRAQHSCVPLRCIVFTSLFAAVLFVFLFCVPLHLPLRLLQRHSLRIYLLLYTCPIVVPPLCAVHYLGQVGGGGLEEALE